MPTLYDKLFSGHTVTDYGDGSALLYIDRQLLHEVSSPQGFAGLHERGLRVARADAQLAVADHAVPTRHRAATHGAIADPQARACYFPMVIERYETVPDSGGAGKFRGGNGIHMSYRFTEAGSISIHDDRWFIPPWGVNGGQPAQRSWKRLDRADGTQQPLPAKCDSVAVQPGDLLHFVTWGGGGWGDPLERDPALVALEVARGLVSAKGAADYGVVLSQDGSVDVAATEAQRGRLRSQRGALTLFNRGPDIDLLRERCLADTGMAAPRAPVWRVAA